MSLTLDDIEKLKKVFATKDDLKIFATKDDLKRFATKDDLIRFATKEDLEDLASKQDLIEFKSDIFDKIDSVLKELVTMREELTVVTHRVSNHEDRLESLEKIHPHGKHLPVVND